MPKTENQQTVIRHLLEIIQVAIVKISPEHSWQELSFAAHTRQIELSIRGPMHLEHFTNSCTRGNDASIAFG
jgi:hypothetical protein